MLSKYLILAFILVMTNFVSVQAQSVETGVPQTLAQWRAANYSDVRYKLNLTLEKMSPTLKGTITVSLKNKADQIILDWRKTRGKEDSSKISNVFINGKPAFRSVSEPPASANGFNNNLKFEEINEHLVFKDGVVAGENIIKLDFTSPIAPSGAAVTRYVDKEDSAEYIYSLFVPSDASTAFPVFDQPDLKARFSLSATFPRGWRAISNTEVESKFTIETTHCSKNCAYDRFDFYETKPISTYVFAFAAGDFEVFKGCLYGEGGEPEGREVAKCLETSGEAETRDWSKIYVRKSQAGKFKPHAAETFRLNREAVKYLETYFDYKFPFPKYDLVLIPEFPFGGMEHAGATFLRETSVIFPSEPTANDFISRANLIFHEAAHQWFGDTVTMQWFDDLWLKEGFAEFMAYKTLEKVLPEYNAWKAFYERNKPLAYLTDSTKGTTPIYQEIPNLSAAKSAYGNIVYRKAPSFLRQAEFYLGEDKFQTAVRAFLKKYQFKNAEWKDLVTEFQNATWVDRKNDDYYQKLSPEEKEKIELNRKEKISAWANVWVKQPGMPLIQVSPDLLELPYETKDLVNQRPHGGGMSWLSHFWQRPVGSQVGSQEAVNTLENNWTQNIEVIRVFGDGTREKATVNLGFEFYGAVNIKSRNRSGAVRLPTLPEEESRKLEEEFEAKRKARLAKNPLYVFPNYQDYGYGIFLLDEKSREYVLRNIQNEKDPFLRSMMWGTLWESVREAELNPKDYVELAIKNISVETDELTIQTILGRVSTAMNYYLTAAQRDEISPRVENLLIEKIQNAPTLGRRITFYRAFLNVASTENARAVLKQILSGDFGEGGGNTKMRAGMANDKSGNRIVAANPAIPLKTKDKFDIVARLLILGDQTAPSLLAELEKTETSDEARRYAYAAGAGIGSAESKAKFWNDFVGNREISESWIEAAFVPFNSIRHAEMTLPYLEKALAELPNLKRNRKIFFVNGWLAAFIGGQTGDKALATVNKFLADNPNLDRDLRLKILENVDALERAVRIRAKYGK